MWLLGQNGTALESAEESSEKKRKLFVDLTQSASEDESDRNQRFPSLTRSREGEVSVVGVTGPPLHRVSETLEKKDEVQEEPNSKSHFVGSFREVLDNAQLPLQSEGQPLVGEKVDLKVVTSPDTTLANVTVVVENQTIGRLLRQTAVWLGPLLLSEKLRVDSRVASVMNDIDSGLQIIIKINCFLEVRACSMMFYMRSSFNIV